MPLVACILVIKEVEVETEDQALRHRGNERNFAINTLSCKGEVLSRMYREETECACPGVGS